MLTVLESSNYEFDPQSLLLTTRGRREWRRLLRREHLLVMLKSCLFAVAEGNGRNISSSKGRRFKWECAGRSLILLRLTALSTSRGIVMRLAEELGGSGISGHLCSKRLGSASQRHARRHDWRMAGLSELHGPKIG